MEVRDISVDRAKIDGRHANVVNIVAIVTRDGRHHTLFVVGVLRLPRSLSQEERLSLRL